MKGYSDDSGHMKHSNGHPWKDIVMPVRIVEDKSMLQRTQQNLFLTIPARNSIDP